MHRGVYPTACGMHCLWDQAAFSAVGDYDSWERELLDDADIGRHIAAGHLVPLNIGSDGAMEVEVRVGTPGKPAELTAREAKYLIVNSEPYRLCATGPVGVSGLEHVAVPPGARVGTIPLPSGECAVTLHLIAWDEEPGMRTDDGPAAGALPDYLALINPHSAAGVPYRTAVRTFDGPEKTWRESGPAEPGAGGSAKGTFGSARSSRGFAGLQRSTKSLEAVHPEAPPCSRSRLAPAIPGFRSDVPHLKGESVSGWIDPKKPTTDAA